MMEIRYKENYLKSAIMDAKGFPDSSSIEKLIPDIDRTTNFFEEVGDNDGSKLKLSEKLLLHGDETANFFKEVGDSDESKLKLSEKLLQHGDETGKYEMSALLESYEDVKNIAIGRTIPDDQKTGLFSCCFNMNIFRKKKKKTDDFCVAFQNPQFLYNTRRY